MSKASQKILKGAREVQAFARGELTEGFIAHVPDVIDVRAIRKKLGVNRKTFATRFGFPVDTVKDWELGRRRPEQAARAFLIVIEKETEAVTRALATS